MKLLLVLLLLVTSHARAGLVPHEFVLHINAVGFLVNDGEPLCRPEGSRFGCDYSPGDSIVGHFAVDDSLLLQDGNRISAPIFNFFLAVGSVTFNQHALLLFWHLTDSDRLTTPAFDVLHGEIVGLRGGVMTDGDSRFLTWGPDSFFRLSDQRVLLTGTQSLRRAEVPEPPVWLLMLWPLLWVAMRAR